MLPIVERDRTLLPYNNYLEQQQARFYRVRASLTGGGLLCDFANAHEYFGFHHTREGWVYREWAPAVDGVSLMGDFNGWDETACPLTRGENGVWELRLPKAICPRHKGLQKSEEDLPVFRRVLFLASGQSILP